MCLMNSVLSRYLDKFVLVFLDEILVYSKNEEERLRLKLQLLKENKMYAKLIKCDSFKDKIHYLGHIIIDEGISMGLEKLRPL